MQHPSEEILIDFILDELPENEARIVREHIEDCDTCRERLRKLMATLSILNEFKDVEPSGNIKERVLEQLELAAKPKIMLLPIEELEKKARKRRPLLGSLAIAAMLLFAFYLGQIYFPKVFAPRGVLLNARLEVPSKVMPDSTIPVRFASWNEAAGSLSEAPQRNEEVTFSLLGEGKTLVSEKAKTDNDGFARKNLNLKGIPPGQYDLTVQSRGNRILETPIEVRKAYDIRMITDRPIYKPGDEIKARVQVRDINQASATGAKVVFILKDPEDGLAKEEEKICDEYGVAVFSFPLADLVPIGEYLLTARVEGDESKKKIFVDDYTLPAFRIELQTKRDSVAVSKGFEGIVKADYFFGEPVINAGAKIEYFVSKSDSLDKVYETSGYTDNSGKFKFTIDSSNLASKVGNLEDPVESFFRISVDDSANRHEEIVKAFQLAKDEIVVKVIPEGGRIRPLIKNIIYVVTSSPSGEPLKCNLSMDLDGVKSNTQTSDLGVYSFEYTPQKDKAPLNITADAGNGMKVEKKVFLDASEEYFSFIVRSLKAVYTPGENLKLEAIVPFSAPVNIQLDLYKGDHWIASKDVTINDAVTKIDWSVQDASGELTVEAALVRSYIVYARDRAKIIVSSPDELKIDVSTNQKTYEPGSSLDAKVKVTRDSEPRQSSIGAVAMDESIIESGKKAESFSKFALNYNLTVANKTDKEMDEYQRALINTEEKPGQELVSRNKTSFMISPDEIEKKQLSMRLYVNRWTILQAFILAVLLYLSVIFTLVTALVNIRRGALGRFPLSKKGLGAMKSLATWGSLSSLAFAICLGSHSMIVFAVGLFFMVGFVVSLGGCMRHADIIVDNSALIQVIASVGLILSALLLAHLWMIYPYLRDLRESNPLMNTSFLGILASIGCMTIVAIFLIPRQRGEEQ